MRLIITGGAGFIGSSVVRHTVQELGWTVLNIDKLTYAGDLQGLSDVEGHANYQFFEQDICDKAAMKQLFQEFQPDAIMHLAAESHVDRSIDCAEEFIQTNIIGTYRLLEVSRAYYMSLGAEKQKTFLFHHVSTDEVYGALGAEGMFTEDTAYQPHSPYSASKASADHLVRAWFDTYGLPVVLTNCSNNYGPYQFPEKLIPLMITNILEDGALPVYGSGENVRDWLYVEDHVRALIAVLTKGAIGETYNIGGNEEKTNLEIVYKICDILDDLRPNTDGKSHKERIEFVTDRPGHDFRYAIDSSKLQNALGWEPKESFESGIEKTVKWYVENPNWWERLKHTHNTDERLGAIKMKG